MKEKIIEILKLNEFAYTDDDEPNGVAVAVPSTRYNKVATEILELIKQEKNK